MAYYLDCDTTPALRSRYVGGGLQAAKRAALGRLAGVTEGQIGIYTTHIGDGFAGYGIKYPGEEPYFEDLGARDGLARHSPPVAAALPRRSSPAAIAELVDSRSANDNHRSLFPSIDRAIPGQALTLNQPHRRFGRCYAEFVGHCGDGKHVLVRKLISSTWKARWTRPLKVERALVISVSTTMARAAAEVA